MALYTLWKLLLFFFIIILSCHSFLPKNYYSEGNILILTSGIKQPFKIWFDAEHQMSRIDLFNGETSSIQKKKDGKLFTYKFFFKTDDDFVSTLSCRYFESSQLESMLPDLQNFKLNITDSSKQWTYSYEEFSYKHLYQFITDLYNIPKSFKMKGKFYFNPVYPNEYLIDYNVFKADSIDSQMFNFPIDENKCAKIEPPTYKNPNLSINKNFKYRDDLNDTLYKQESFNWDLNGIHTQVRDQGTCGSCWSFSTTGTLEGSYNKQNANYNNIINFSEQFLVDCTWIANNGCNGGDPYTTLEWVQKNGIPLRDSYASYKANNGVCKVDTKTMKLYKPKKVFQVEEDVVEVKKALIKYGPLSATLDVAESMTVYTQGIYSNPKCGQNKGSHAVVIIGWGFNALTNQSYWILKNSWSYSWGIAGYAYLDMKYDCRILERVTAVEW